MASIFSRAVASLRFRLGESRRRRALTPPVGGTDFGGLRRTEPISRTFGLDRGTPIDRYYIERFLGENGRLIRGRVLEIGDRTYTERFGTGVEHSDVLHVSGESPEATIIADLTNAPQIADSSFDCIILTQTLQFTYDMAAEVAELHRILKPGGSVLCTVPGISQISRFDEERWGDYWRLTARSARELFETAFPSEAVHVETFGNVLAAIAFLHGLALSELERSELDVHDEEYQVIVAVRAVKKAV